MYKCIEQDFPKLEKRIKAIIKKLDKHGVPYTYKVIESTNEEVNIIDYSKEKYFGKKVGTAIVSCVNYTFEMEPLKIGEYKPIAVIDHSTLKGEEGMNLIYPLDEEETIPEEYRKVKSNCDHCKVNRKRNKTVLLKNPDGKIVQVGTTCIKDYTGIDAVQVLDAYTEVHDIMINQQELYISHSSMASYSCGSKTVEYLACCIKLIETQGYVNQYNSSDKVPATKLEALRLVLNKEVEDNSPYMVKAKEVISYFEGYDGYDNFALNIKALLVQPYTKASGIIAYAYIAYQKNMEKAEKVKEEAETSEWVGNPGDKITTDLTLQRKFSFETMYGMKYMYLFKDEAGNVYKWGTQNYLEKGNEPLQHGETITLKGTIKDHETYNSTKQTVLTRCKVITPQPEQGEQVKMEAI